MTLEATREVAVPLVSGVVIIITVFMPLLALQGLEGRLFAPGGADHRLRARRRR